MPAAIPSTFNKPQIPLDLSLSTASHWQNFVAGDNQTAVLALQTLQEPLTLITGQCGKSHALQACCHHTNACNRTAVYLPLDLPGMQPEMLHGLEQQQLVCLDNLEMVLGQEQWERSLYDLLNRCRDNGSLVVVALQHSPKQTPMLLADLRSRLQWGPEYHLNPLADDDLLQALTLQAESRGMHMPIETVHYLLARASRDLHELMALLERLDVAQLAEKRSLSIPFIRQFIS